MMHIPHPQVYSATEAYNEALECLDRAVRLDPSKALPRFDRTRVLQKAGRLQVNVVQWTLGYLNPQWFQVVTKMFR